MNTNTVCVSAQKTSRQKRGISVDCILVRFDRAVSRNRQSFPYGPTTTELYYCTSYCSCWSQSEWDLWFRFRGVIYENLSARRRVLICSRQISISYIWINFRLNTRHSCLRTWRHLDCRFPRSACCRGLRISDYSTTPEFLSSSLRSSRSHLNTRRRELGRSNLGFL